MRQPQHGLFRRSVIDIRNILEQRHYRLLHVRPPYSSPHLIWAQALPAKTHRLEVQCRQDQQRITRLGLHHSRILAHIASPLQQQLIAGASGSISICGDLGPAVDNNYVLEAGSELIVNQTSLLTQANSSPDVAFAYVKPYVQREGYRSNVKQNPYAAVELSWQSHLQ